LDDEELIFLLKRINPVELDLSRSRGISEASFMCMVQHCTRLKTLRLRSGRIPCLSSVSLGKLMKLEILDLTET